MSKWKIMIVEDNEASAKLLREVMELRGFEVIEAYNGLDALYKLRHTKVDLILSDVNMSQLDGYGLVKEIRLDNSLKEIPFLMYSEAATTEEALELSARAGVDEYVEKGGMDLIVDRIMFYIKKATGRK